MAISKSRSPSTDSLVLAPYGSRSGCALPEPQRVWQQVVLGRMVLGISQGAEQDLHRGSAHLTPIDLMASQAGNLLSPGPHDAHLFGHAHAAPPQFFDREA